MRIKRADERYQEGKRLFQYGDLNGARTEFDRAIDILLGTPENASDRSKVERKLEELVAAIHRYDVNNLGAGDLVDRPGYDKAPLEQILEMTFPVDPNLKPKVNEQLASTQSQLPLQVTDAVLSYINFFSGERGRRTLLAGLKRAGRYKPMIRRILSEEGVPQELIYLAQAESGFLPRAVSHKAATGMWQFVQFRGREYGLKQTSFTDDRLDPEKATRSAARHLRDLYEHFGDWYLAIAAYNCGPGGVEKAVQRTGYADFWELRARRAIPRETTNYVPIILAMTIMHKNAQAYRLEDVEVDPPLEYDTLEMTAPTHLALVADAADRPVSDVRELNPALLTNVAPRNYELRIPKGSSGAVIAGLDGVPEARRASWRIHRVTEGETLASIARRYSMPVSTLTAVNGSDELGRTLLIPAQERIIKLTPASSRRAKSSVASSRKSAKSAVKRATTTRPVPARRAIRRASGATVHTASFR